MKTIIAIFSSLILTIFGTALICAPFSDPPFAIALLVSSVVGVYLGTRFSTMLAYKPDRHQKIHTRRADSNVIPFLDRLAEFVGRKSDEDISTNPKNNSKMPFWIADITLERSHGKDASYIRRTLLRIRSILTGNAR